MTLRGPARGREQRMLRAFGADLLRDVRSRELPLVEAAADLDIGEAGALDYVNEWLARWRDPRGAL